MANRLFFLLVGFGLTTIGFVYIISYLNLLTMGYNLAYYIKFIFRRIECFYAIIGIIIIILTIILPRGKNYELYL